MGSDKAEKEKAKLEKKRVKAQLKAEKARAKEGIPPETALGTPEPGPAPKTPWYKDPNWVRAIVAAATLIIMIITLFLTI